MFLDSGDGIVFVGEFGPWYSDESKEFHLSRDAARDLLRGTIETYMNQDGRELKEIFLHARSGLNSEEFTGFSDACPEGVDLVGIRVRKDRLGPRLFRHDDHPNAARRGKHPVLRGTFWQRTKRHGLLFTSGFKPRITTYDGWEVPIPLSITIQYGKADILQVATDILGLTKLNYNSCQLGESQPITVKYSDRIGEILLANPDVPREQWRHNFKYYT
jgi:argonaute-like protein implicated in RNA metabolism and viral defense